MLSLATTSTNAQVVTIANPTGYDWSGHVRIEAPSPASLAGWSPVEHVPHWSVVSQDDGSAVIDLMIDLGAGRRKIVDLGASQAAARPIPWIADLGALYAGQPLVGGVGLTYAMPEAGGAGIALRGHAVLGAWTCTASMVVYPSEPGVTPVRLTARCWHPAGPGIPMRLTADIRWSWGDALVWGPAGTDIVWPAGTVAVSGVPIEATVVCYWHRLATAADLHRAHALRAGGLVWSSR